MKPRTRTKPTPPRLVLPAVPLARDELACQSCGVAVVRPATESRLIALGRRRVQGGMIVLDERVMELSVTRCAGCSERRARAARILDAHPRVRVRLGGPSYVLGLIDAALAVLEVLGIPPEDAGRYAENDRDVRLLLDRLPAAGAEVLWSARLVPIIEVGRDPESCAPARWAHVTEQQAAGLRVAFASMLQRRIERPLPYPPPSDGARGCLLCGVGTVVALPSRAQSVGVWSGPWSANPSTLGGRPRPGHVSGYLCPACTVVVEEVGALGPSALERALIAHLGVRSHNFSEVELSGFRAWAALPEGALPNAMPWQHEPRLDDFARELQSVI